VTVGDAPSSVISLPRTRRIYFYHCPGPCAYGCNTTPRRTGRRVPGKYLSR